MSKIVTKIVKKIKFERVWGRLRSKKMFPETIIYKIFGRNSSFHMKQGTTGKVLIKFSFWEEDWALGYISMTF